MRSQNNEDKLNRGEQLNKTFKKGQNLVTLLMMP